MAVAIMLLLLLMIATRRHFHCISCGWMAKQWWWWIRRGWCQNVPTIQSVVIELLFERRLFGISIVVFPMARHAIYYYYIELLWRSTFYFRVNWRKAMVSNYFSLKRNWNCGLNWLSLRAGRMRSAFYCVTTKQYDIEINLEWTNGGRFVWDWFISQKKRIKIDARYVLFDGWWARSWWLSKAVCQTVGWQKSYLAKKISSVCRLIST